MRVPASDSEETPSPLRLSHWQPRSPRESGYLRDKCAGHPSLHLRHCFNLRLKHIWDMSCSALESGITREFSLCVRVGFPLHPSFPL